MIGIHKFKKAKAKAKKYVGGINFTLTSVSTVPVFFTGVRLEPVNLPKLSLLLGILASLVSLLESFTVGRMWLTTGWVVRNFPEPPTPGISSKVAIFFACYRGRLGPSGPKSKKKSENGFPGPLGPGVEKVEKESKKSPKSPKIVNFGLFFDSFSTFSTPGPRAYCGTNWKCIAAFPFLQSLEASKAQRYKWGAYCGANWRCTARTFQTSDAGGGFLSSSQVAQYVEYVTDGGYLGWALWVFH